MPTLPPLIGCSCSTCSWILLAVAEEAHDDGLARDVRPQLAADPPRLAGERDAAAAVALASSATFSLSVPCDLAPGRRGRGNGGRCRRRDRVALRGAPAGTAAAAAAATGRARGRAGAARRPARLASRAMASVVMTLPTVSSRNPHQGSSFVKPNEIELWNACNMMHGSKDAGRRSSRQSATPKGAEDDHAAIQFPPGRWTRPKTAARRRATLTTRRSVRSASDAEQEAAEEELLGQRRQHARHHAEADQHEHRVLRLEVGDDVLVLGLAER